MTVRPGPGAQTRRCNRATRGAKRKHVPKTCPYLTLSTIVTTGQFWWGCGVWRQLGGCGIFPTSRTTDDSGRHMLTDVRDSQAGSNDISHG